jgi:hypothetical protein
MVWYFMRPYIRHVAAVCAVGLLACSDTSTAPTGRATPMASADRPSLDLGGQSHWSSRTTSFTLTSAGGSFDVGGFFTLNVPADGVCSLTSSYGPGTWDDQCATLGPDESITVTATYGFSGSGPVVDFSPELRFSPNAQVTLSTSLYSSILTLGASYFSQHPSALGFFGMYYVPALGAGLVTDAASDPSLVTHVNLTTGLVWRRIKHFSGYNVATGLACTPSPDDPDCVEVPPVVDQQP